MTKSNEQILKKALKKAIGNGMPMVIDADRWITQEHYFEIIFSHDFAKAFWGEDKKVFEVAIPNDLTLSDIERATEVGVAGRGLPAYLWHLQQMVLEKEPLKYLAQFLEEEKE